MKAKYNKSEIFKAAWKLVKETSISLSQALKSAWNKFKNNMKTWFNKEVTTDSFVNARGNTRINIALDGKRIFSYTKGDSLETVIEDAIFELRDVANRNSIFNKKEDIANLIKLVY